MGAVISAILCASGKHTTRHINALTSTLWNSLLISFNQLLAVSPWGQTVKAAQNATSTLMGIFSKISSLLCLVGVAVDLFCQIDSDPLIDYIHHLLFEQ